ncbi:hypothetical protein [Paraflavitalea speifideaquila]|uniref:hypothetical protein n=1 Tax=Paraflavitalea speifideaquila TaxID=3076558 RepID=UPI0028EF00E6|nr:hypothetical protein [Paraflavitalea speifideiaquila]
MADPFADMPEILKRTTPGNYLLGSGFIEEPSIALTLDFNKMAIYGVDKAAVEDVLKQQFGIYTISELKQLGETKAIRLKTDRTTLTARLAATVTSRRGPATRFIISCHTATTGNKSLSRPINQANTSPFITRKVSGIFPYSTTANPACRPLWF